MHNIPCNSEYLWSCVLDLNATQDSQGSSFQGWQAQQGAPPAITLSLTVNCCTEGYVDHIKGQHIRGPAYRSLFLPAAEHWY